MADLQESLDRGEAGILDPYKEHRERPVSEHLAEYLPYFNEQASNKHYKSENKRLLEKTFKLCGISKLGDLTSEKFEDFLTSLDKAPNTKRRYRVAMSGFATWLFKRRRTPENIIWRVDVPKGGVKNEIRSLSLDELKKLFATAEKRPLMEALTVRVGENKGKRVANIRDVVRRRLLMLGRERVLLYKFALFTGLRKEEIERIRVSHINFTHSPNPVLVLPAELTKGKKDASLWLLREYAAELKSWLEETKRRPEDNLFYVASDQNAIFTRDLKAAGVTVTTEKGTAKFRSLRKSANVVLREAGVPAHVRKLFMRHSDIKLTTGVYDDGRLEDMEEVIPALEGIWGKMGQQVPQTVAFLKSHG